MDVFEIMFGDSDSESEFEGFEPDEVRPVADHESDVEIDFDNISVSDVSSVSSVLSDDEAEQIEPGTQNVGHAWSSELHDVHANDFKEYVGPKHELGEGALPIDYFHLLLPESFFELLCEQTNLYAERRQAATGVDGLWKPATVKEMKLYVAIGIMMGIHKLPRQRFYWSTDDRLHCAPVAKLMSQNRYSKISQYLHLNDSAGYIERNNPGFDPLYKIRPLIEVVSRTFPAHYKPGRELSIDEAMIKYNGRLYFKQYIRLKPNPWGIKVWCLADPRTGYLLHSDVYTGKTNHTYAGGLGHHVVMTLGKDYLDKYHQFFFDNFFNSVPLQQELLQRKTYACGTIRVNRKGWPEDLVFNQRTPKAKRLKRGELRMKQRGDMVATVWQDKRVVSVLSTGIPPTMGSAKRRTGAGPRAEKEIPTPVLTYNQNMGGVDLFDQNRSYYGVGRQSKKWWRYLFWFYLEAAIINAGIIYKRSTPPSKYHEAVFFRLEVYEGLIKNNVVAKQQARQHSSFAGRAISDPTQHPVVKMPGRARNCFLCQQEKKRTASGRGVQSTYGCVLCKVNLCRGVCFARFHAQLLQ